jgi:non-specific serine/threonine protein kinase
MLERQINNNPTDRQADIAGLVAQGFTNKAIAFELGISIYTVMRHMQNIRAKLGAENRAAVAAWVGRMDATADNPTPGVEAPEGD